MWSRRSVAPGRRSLPSTAGADWYLWLISDLSGLSRLDETQQAIRGAIELQPTAAGYHQTLTIIEVQRPCGAGARRRAAGA
jgi:hypothetical protein